MVCGVGYRNVGLTVRWRLPSITPAPVGRCSDSAGWHEPEHDAFGYDALSLGDRISRLDEASRLARTMLDGGPATQAGAGSRPTR